MPNALDLKCKKMIIFYQIILKRKIAFLSFFDKSKDKILLHLDEKWHTEEYSIAYKKAKKIDKNSFKFRRYLKFC